MAAEQYSVDFWYARPVGEEVSDEAGEFDNLEDARDHLYAAMTQGAFQFSQLCRLDGGEWAELESIDRGKLGRTGDDNRKIAPLSTRLKPREREKIVLKLRLARNGGPLPTGFLGATASRAGSMLRISFDVGEGLVAFESGEITLSAKVDATNDSYEPRTTVAEFFEDIETAIMHIVQPDWPLEL